MPAEVQDVHAALGTWDPERDPGLSQDEQTLEFWRYASERPEVARRHVNHLVDLLRDEVSSPADKRELILDATNRWFETPEAAVGWLEDLVRGLLADRPVARTTSIDGEAPSLGRIYGLNAVLRSVRADVGGLVDPAGAARVLGRLRRADEMARDLLALMDSDFDDRAKADFVVENVGPHFYSDLEAIEWAAEVARRVLQRPRAVEDSDG